MTQPIMTNALQNIRTHDGLVPFPPDTAERYLASGAWRRRSLAAEFRVVARKFPNRPALIAGDTTWTYGELDAEADCRAAGLLGLGLRPGSAVILQVNNSAEAILTWYALLKAGLIPVCTLSVHRQHEIGEISKLVAPVGAHIVDADNPRFDLVEFASGLAAEGIDTGTVLTIGKRKVNGVTSVSALASDSGDGIVSEIDTIQRGLKPEDIAVFQLSGGTTGTPKVIPRLHGEYWFNALSYAHRLTWTEDARVAYIGPFVHNAGIICGVHGPHSVGACAIIGSHDLDRFFDLLAEHDATDTLLGAFSYDAAIDPRLTNARRLERVLFSGKKVPPQHATAMRERAIWFGQLFGMGEGLCMVTPLNAPETIRATTVGTPLADHDEIRILDPGSERALPADTVGELCVRGPYTIRGYIHADEHNERAFTSDGYYRTGDLAAEHVIDGISYYSIEGRIKDLINRGGEKVNAEELELLLISHPRIREAALVAMPDERLGERACAYLVAHGDPLTLDEIREYLESLGVAKFKWPERLVWLDEMPRSNVGKIDKKGLREQASSLCAEGR